MKSAAAALLALGMLLGASGGDAPIPGNPRVTAAPTPVEAMTVTLPVPQAPVFVRDVSTPATVGAARGGRRPASLEGELLSAYTFAVAAAPERCHLPLSLLAAIGQVESGNAAGHAIDASHRVVPAIIGPALDGSRHAAVPDTDGGVLDGDTLWDRAVGPFQFIPSSWRVAGVDFDDDGIRDPQNVYDAAGAAMVYLCAGDRDLDDPRQLDEAVLAYNHSRAYLRAVLAWKAVFDGGGLWDVHPVPDLEASALARAAPPPPSASGTIGQTSADAAPPAAAPAANPPAPTPTPTTPPPAPAPTPTPPAANPPAVQVPAEEPEPDAVDEIPDPVAEPPEPPDVCPVPEEPTDGRPTPGPPEKGAKGASEDKRPVTGTPRQDETPPTDDCAPVPEPTEPTQPEPTQPEPTQPEPTQPEPTQPEPTQPEPGEGT